MNQSRNQRSIQRLPLPMGTGLRRRYTLSACSGMDTCALSYTAMDNKTRQTVEILEFFPESIAFRSSVSPAVSPISKTWGEAFFKASEAFLFQYNALTQAIGSPNIVSVLDAFFENGTAYAVLEPMRGLRLSDYLLRQKRTLSKGELSGMMKSLSDGLLVVHSLSILHHDICADTIWLCADGTMKLTGFGAAKKLLIDQADIENDPPTVDIRDLGETLLRAYARDMPLETVEPGILRDIFKRMLATAPSLQFGSIFDFRHAVSELDIPAERHEVTSSMLEKQPQPAPVKAMQPVKVTYPAMPTADFFTSEPEAASSLRIQKGRGKQNWMILAAYGLMVLGSLIIALVLKRML